MLVWRCVYIIYVCVCVYVCVCIDVSRESIIFWVIAKSHLLSEILYSPHNYLLPSESF